MGEIPFLILGFLVGGLAGYAHAWRLRESVKRSVQVMLQANRETEAAVHISELEAENARLREAATAFLNVADRKTKEADDLRAALDEGMCGV
jgi:hypothetical protein